MTDIDGSFFDTLTTQSNDECLFLRSFTESLYQHGLFIQVAISCISNLNIDPYQAPDVNQYQSVDILLAGPVIVDMDNTYQVVDQNTYENDPASAATINDQVINLYDSGNNLLSASIMVRKTSISLALGTAHTAHTRLRIWRTTTTSSEILYLRSQL